MQGLELGLRGAGQLGQLGQQQFGQQMDITGLQARMGAAQQQREQQILDQQYADFQAQRDLPFQQLGFYSDLLRGAGGTSRSIYAQPGPSAMQNIAGLGTAALGLKGLMAEGGEVQGYADGGLTALLGDQELAQRAQNPTTSPMGQLAAQQQMAENAALRAAAPQGMPQPMVEDTMDPIEAALVVEMQKAMNEGDRQRAEALAETVERRREERMAQEEMGIAAVADDSIGDIPEGGITGMEPVMAAEGGEMRFFDGGDTLSRDEEMLQQLLGDPDAESAAGRALRALGRGAKRAFLYSSDAEALRAAGRLPEATAVAPEAAPVGIEQAVAASNATDAMRNQSRKATREASQERVAEAAAAAKDKPPTAGPGTATNPMQQGLGSAAAVPRMGFDTQAAMANEFGAQQGIAASLVQGADEAIAAQEEAAKARGLFGEAREKRLKEEEEGLKGKRDEARSMALFQAGLSILSADPSRGALAAIGSGAIQGLGAYKGDLKDLQSRQERIRDKMDEIEDIRRREADADGKEKRALIAERNKAVVEGQKLMANTMSRFTDINREDANIIADRVFRRDLASMPSGEERILRALGGGDLAKGFEISKRLGQKPADLMGEFNDYLKANPTLGMAPQEQQLAAFFRTKMTLGGINVPKPTDKPTGQARP
jgi:tetratricopeptide (TPR) repeat protein